MEAFGAVVNICSFIDLASRLVVTLSAYVSEVKSAEDSRKRFLDELRQYVLVLEDLKSFTQRTEEEDSSDKVESLKMLASFCQQNSPHTTNFYHELEALLAWLDRGMAKRGKMNLRQKIRWPMEGKKRVERLMPVLSRHIQVFTLALSITAWCVHTNITISFL